MKYEEKVLYTFCAYLENGFGCISFKKLFNNTEIPDPFEHLKSKFRGNAKESEEFLSKLEKYLILYKCFWEEDYPSRLKELPNPPIIIFYKGNISIANKDIISIVGTRKCSQMGVKYAKIFTEELSKHFVICSGLAFGIDAIANKISAEIPSKSIAVLPGSLINPSPSSNKYIFDKIIKSNGLVLSEYPFTDNFTKGAYVARNRIIAGLAENILLIESPINGGSLITCRIGFSNNSHVFTIPANIDLKSFEGNNYLLKTLVARAVTTPFDFIKWGSQELISSHIELNLSQDEELIVETIRKFDDYDSICLALNGKLAFEKIYDIILNLEISGIITRDITGRYSIN